MSVYQLWLPILVSGVVTHVLSTLAWTVLPHHRPEWKRLPAENDFQDWVVSNSVAPGQYIFPFAEHGNEIDMKDYKSKAAKCTGTLTLWDSPTNMGKAIGLTITFFLFIAFVIGYLASIGLKPGASFMQVLQFVTTAGLLAHCSAKFPHAFWFRRKNAMDLLDGVVYALATGLTFAFFWPGQ